MCTNYTFMKSNVRRRGRPEPATGSDLNVTGLVPAENAEILLVLPTSWIRSGYNKYYNSWLLVPVENSLTSLPLVRSVCEFRLPKIVITQIVYV